MLLGRIKKELTTGQVKMINTMPKNLSQFHHVVTKDPKNS